MDKETLSNYGWIVICVLVLAVMIALAGPFGNFIADAVKSTAQGLFDVNQGALDAAGIVIDDNGFADAEGGNGESGEQGNLIPSGGTYYVGVTSTTAGDYTGATATYTAGQAFPETVNEGDVYVYGDYEYRYKYRYTFNTNMQIIPAKWSSGANNWGVRVLNDAQTSYGEILESVNGQPVTNLSWTFYKCKSLIDAPDIPSSITNMDGAFADCDALVTAPVIPNNVVSINSTFYSCDVLTGTVTINANLSAASWGITCFESTKKSISINGTCKYLTEIANACSNVTVKIF